MDWARKESVKRERPRDAVVQAVRVLSRLPRPAGALRGRDLALPLRDCEMSRQHCDPRLTQAALWDAVAGEELGRPLHLGAARPVHSLGIGRDAQTDELTNIRLGQSQNGPVWGERALVAEMTLRNQMQSVKLDPLRTLEDS